MTNKYFEIWFYHLINVANIVLESHINDKDKGISWRSIPISKLQDKVEDHLIKYHRTKHDDDRRKHLNEIIDIINYLAMIYERLDEQIESDNK